MTQDSFVRDIHEIGRQLHDLVQERIQILEAIGMEGYNDYTEIGELPNIIRSKLDGLQHDLNYARMRINRIQSNTAPYAAMLKGNMDIIKSFGKALELERALEEEYE